MVALDWDADEWRPDLGTGIDLVLAVAAVVAVGEAVPAVAGVC